MNYNPFGDAFVDDKFTDSNFTSVYHDPKTVHGDDEGGDKFVQANTNARNQAVLFYYRTYSLDSNVIVPIGRIEVDKQGNQFVVIDGKFIPIDEVFAKGWSTWKDAKSRKSFADGYSEGDIEAASVKARNRNYNLQGEFGVSNPNNTGTMGILIRTSDEAKDFAFDQYVLFPVIEFTGAGVFRVFASARKIGGSLQLAREAAAQVAQIAKSKDFTVAERIGILKQIGDNAAFSPEVRQLARGQLGKLEAAAAAVKTACFVAGTPLLTPDGAKPIEQIQEGDLILSRNEFDPSAKIEAKLVEATFVRSSPIIEIWVVGQTIRTTAEHPFYVWGHGWRMAAELQIGDVLGSHEDKTVPVAGIALTGEAETVYNLRVADYHTYFVGCQEWGFSVWAHNTCYEVYSFNGKHYVRQKGTSHTFKKPNGDALEFATKADAEKWIAANGTAGPHPINYPLKPGVDADWRGTGKTAQDALDEAFKQTGRPKSDFEVTRWAKDQNGKSRPVEWRTADGAEVSLDLAHYDSGWKPGQTWATGPDAPHIGWQTAGKRGSGGAKRGHILVDDVPANR